MQVARSCAQPRNRPEPPAPRAPCLLPAWCVCKALLRSILGGRLLLRSFVARVSQAHAGEKKLKNHAGVSAEAQGRAGSTDQPDPGRMPPAPLHPLDPPLFPGSPFCLALRQWTAEVALVGEIRVSSAIGQNRVFIIIQVSCQHEKPERSENLATLSPGAGSPRCLSFLTRPKATSQGCCSAAPLEVGESLCSRQSGRVGARWKRNLSRTGELEQEVRHLSC